MNNRQAILERLREYLPRVTDALEASHVLKTIDFIARTPNAFERQHETLGHVGASAVVVNPNTHQILLAQHTVLHQLSFFGNHCDGREDLPAVARERMAKDADAVMAQPCVWKPDWLDVDVHYVPPHQRSNGDDVPAHLHYDIALLFYTDTTERPNQATRWVAINDACQHTQADSQFQRIIGKLKDI
jgi:hypothetical protein